MLLLFTVLFACGPSAPTAPAGGPKAALVEVAEVREGKLSDTWTLLGEVTALERAELAAGAAGAVQKVTAREGDAVEKGTLLLEVDSALAIAEYRSAEAAVERARAELEAATRTVGRVGRVAEGVLAPDEVDQATTRETIAKADLSSAQAASQLASAKLGRHRVRAPFPGVIARRRVDPGDWVNPGDPVLDLVRLDEVEVRVSAPVEVASRVQVGDTVQLGAIAGTVLGVVPALDPISRTSLIRVRPEGSLGENIPGSSIDVGFDLQMSGGVIVPRDALVSGPTESRVFRVVDGTAQAVLVVPLTRTADEVLVQAEGLSAGDRVVVRGNERLRPDQAVRIR